MTDKPTKKALPNDGEALLTWVLPMTQNPI